MLQLNTSARLTIGIAATGAAGLAIAHSQDPERWNSAFGTALDFAIKGAVGGAILGIAAPPLVGVSHLVPLGGALKTAALVAGTGALLGAYVGLFMGQGGRN